MENTQKSVFPLEGYAPSLREVFREKTPDLTRVLRAAIPVLKSEEGPARHEAAALERNAILLTDGASTWPWSVNALRDLFRGDKQPPHFGDYPPEEYDSAFMIMDVHLLEVINVLGDPRDAEVEEVLSILRRRPDGKSTGFLHDYLWQAAALMLGVRALSQAEFEAILGRLIRSCRRFGEGSTSRNYAQSLRMHFQRM